MVVPNKRRRDRRMDLRVDEWRPQSELSRLDDLLVSLLRHACSLADFCNFTVGIAVSQLLFHVSSRIFALGSKLAELHQVPEKPHSDDARVDVQKGLREYKSGLNG